MKQKLVLQVGTGKTGTTYIQETLASNLKALKDFGICYPTNGRKANQAGHHSFYASLCAGKEWWLREEASAEDVLHSIIEEVRSSGCEYGIVSEESLVWIPPEKVHFLAVNLAEFDVRIVVDIRRQDLYVDSALNQIVKAAGQKFTYDELWRFDGTGYVPDYYKIIFKWAKSFGPRSIVIRPYERSQLLGGDILDDFFLRVLGFTVDISRNQSKRAHNDRLSRASLEFKRIMNFLFAERPQVCFQMIDSLHRRDVEQGDTEAAILSDDIRRKILQDTKPHNDAIYAEFNRETDERLRLKPGIFVDGFQPTGAEPFGELTREDVASIIGVISKERPALINAIRNTPVPNETPDYERRKIDWIREQIGA